MKMKTLWLMLVLVFPLAAREPLAQRIAHTDPAKYRPAKAVHGGAGQMDYMVLLDAHSLDTNLLLPAPGHPRAEKRDWPSLSQPMRGDVCHLRRRGAVYH